MLEEIKKKLESEANPKQAQNLQRFFKTGKGQYGEGDVLLGLTSKQINDIAKKYRDLSFRNIQSLLDSKIHEYRVCALRILVHKFERHTSERKQIFEFYLNNTKNINNWDLVDLSAPRIVGHYLSDKDKSILYNLAKSDNLWKKRVSIISTLYFIVKDNQFNDTIKISEMLLKDKHDLIHKAVGWALREVGKKDINVLEDFLKKHHKEMPRTMLRYSIEKFDEDKRKKYLRGEI